MSCQNQTDCGCIDSQKPQIETLPTQVTQSNYKTLFAIPKMDCSAEEQMVRMVLQPIAQIQQLQFDLVNRQLTIWHEEQNIDEMTKQLATLNYGEKWVNTERGSLLIEDAKPDSQQSQRNVLVILLLINCISSDLI